MNEPSNRVKLSCQSMPRNNKSESRLGLSHPPQLRRSRPLRRPTLMQNADSSCKGPSFPTANVDFPNTPGLCSLEAQRLDRLTGHPRRPKLGSDPLFSSLSSARLDLPRPQLAENRSEHENGRRGKTPCPRIDRLFKPNCPPRPPDRPPEPPPDPPRRV